MHLLQKQDSGVTGSKQPVTILTQAGLHKGVVQIRINRGQSGPSVLTLVLHNKNRGTR
jgi:hypothetical protein